VPASLSSVERATESLRVQLADRLGDGFGDLAAETLRDALKSTKKARVQRQCAKCGCGHIEYVDVQDSVTAVAAVKLAVEQLEGRPGVADEQKGQTLTIVRTVIH
jgi:ubiquinone biosynthesis protein UbiJ